MDAFKPHVISETILRRLIKQDVIYHIKVKNKEKGKADPSTIIYHQGKPVDYFVLILEGRVEVTIGREEMRFESGPFTYFGTQALTQSYAVSGRFDYYFSIMILRIVVVQTSFTYTLIYRKFPFLKSLKTFFILCISSVFIKNLSIVWFYHVIRPSMTYN